MRLPNEATSPTHSVIGSCWNAPRLPHGVQVSREQLDTRERVCTVPSVWLWLVVACPVQNCGEKRGHGYAFPVTWWGCVVGGEGGGRGGELVTGGGRRGAWGASSLEGSRDGRCGSVGWVSVSFGRDHADGHQGGRDPRGGAGRVQSALQSCLCLPRVEPVSERGPCVCRTSSRRPGPRRGARVQGSQAEQCRPKREQCPSPVSGSCPSPSPTGGR